MKLIDADALKERKFPNGESAYVTGWNDAISAIMTFQPTVDAEPVKHGKWIMGREKRRYGDCEETTWTCSICGYRRFMTSCPDDKFCKECGADMRGKYE